MDLVLPDERPSERIVVALVKRRTISPDQTIHNGESWDLETAERERVAQLVVKSILEQAESAVGQPPQIVTQRFVDVLDRAQSQEGRRSSWSVRH